MTFRSKIDRPFLTLYSFALFILAIACFLPFFIENEVSLSAVLIAIGFFTGCVFLMLWMMLAISYVFRTDHLFVKAGPFRTRIAYEDITLVSSTSDILTGMRMLSSRDAVEIFYRTALLGSVKVSPAEKEQFLAELKKRVPANTFHKTLQ